MRPIRALPALALLVIGCIAPRGGGIASVPATRRISLVGSEAWGQAPEEWVESLDLGGVCAVDVLALEVDMDQHLEWVEGMEEAMESRGLVHHSYWGRSSKLRTQSVAWQTTFVRDEAVLIDARECRLVELVGAQLWSRGIPFGAQIRDDVSATLWVPGKYEETARTVLRDAESRVLGP